MSFSQGYMSILEVTFEIDDWISVSSKNSLKAVKCNI